MGMEAEPPLETHPMASAVKLICKGSAGQNPGGVDIVWQWAAVSSDARDRPLDTTLDFTDFVPTEADSVQNTSIISDPWAKWCQTERVQSSLLRTLTEADHYRTYRCFPKTPGLAGHLRLAASYRIHTELPDVDLMVYPTKLEFSGESTTQLYQPLQIACYEYDGPMDPVAHVNIQLLHKGKVLLAVDGGPGTDYGVYGTMAPDDRDRRSRTEDNSEPGATRVSNNSVSDASATASNDEQKPAIRQSGDRSFILAAAAASNVVANSTGNNISRAVTSTTQVSDNATTTANDIQREDHTTDANGTSVSETTVSNYAANPATSSYTASASPTNTNRFNGNSDSDEDTEGLIGEEEKEEEEKEDWSPDIRYNADTESDQLMFLSLTTYTVSCQSGGTYQCLFAYTLSVTGARPVTITQLQEVFLPVEVAPQKPNMTTYRELVQSKVNSEVELTCTAYVGGSVITAGIVWETCRLGNCSRLISQKRCRFRSWCSGLSIGKESNAVYHRDTCQFKQISRVIYRFQQEDIGGVSICCYVIKNNRSFAPATRSFAVIDAAPRLQVDASIQGKPKFHRYSNFLIVGVIPGTMSLGFVIFIVVGLSISYSRHQRIQRRLHRSTLFRRNQGRTDHFRKHKPPPRTPSMEKNGRPGRGDLLRSYLRALVFIAYDRTEIETEEEGEGLMRID
ncbi:hypothetical protein V1264_015550 [Littorina saxatilis]|uniref:Uncharacterized protein n=1 Tax=Littorina saxatilis TaxID=31220 RepID=A0AAN9BMD9_9CAEN